MRRSSSIFLVVAAATFLIAGCGDSNAPDTSHVGRYELVSIDGDPVPVAVVDVPGYTLEVTGGSLTLNANNSFVESVTAIETTDGVPSPLDAIACTGHYTRHGSTLSMTTPETDSCAAQTVTGTLSGSTLTVDYDGTTVVYSR